MTQKEKDLLLKDLCGRLPYGVWIERKLKSCKFGAKCMLHAHDISAIEREQYEFCKPYLFPLSSMTEEQKREYNSLRDFVPTYHYEYGDIVEDTELHDNFESIDYLIANHFDYRGLIPMGLANDATGKDIYLTMWRDENGFKHNGPSPYEQRKIKELRSQMTFEEKYKEKVEDACRWLNNFLYSDTDNGIIRVHLLAYKSKKEIIDDFREMMQMD